MPNSRRNFLQSAAGVAASTSMSAARSAAASLPKVKLGAFEVTRLIIGSNPFYGYSHFNRLYDRHMSEWYTQERVLEVLRACEAGGINTWQLSCNPRAISDLRRYLAEGGRMNWLTLADGELGDYPEKMLPELVKLKPMAIVHHGGRTDMRFAKGEMHVVQDYLKRVRDAGVMVGLSTHNPAVIDYVEGRGWDVDFYMTCFYRVSRTAEDARKMLGEAPLPLGEIYLEKDPERMSKMIRQTRKTCFAFKILAAGRSIDTPQQVEQAFRFAFEHIKPQDCVIVGMYPRYKDEVSENIALTLKHGSA
jgi:hypothetical protein